MGNPFDESLISAQLDGARDYAGSPWPSLRPLGWASVICGVVWLFGFGSVFAIGFGLIGIVGRYRVASDRYPPPGLYLCIAGMVLGVIGLAATVGAFVLGVFG